MQRRKHKVTGQRCLDRNLGGLEVSNFADQDGVRVLSKEGPKQLPEGQFLIDVHLTLDQPIDVIFDRVFRGQDLSIRRIQFVERCIKRGGFS